MSRGYWSLFIAAFGWVILSAQAPQPKAPAEQPEAARQPQGTAQPVRPIRVEIVNQATEPQGYQDPCSGTERDQNSDLCAQWTAAKGARDAAFYAWLQLGAAALGMLGLIATIMLTLRAVKASQDSAKAARDTLDHARETSAAQLRPWVSIRVVAHKIARFGEAGLSFDYEIIFKNHGPTVARCYQVRQRLFLPSPNEVYSQAVEEWWRGFEKPDPKGRAVLMPGEEDVFQGWSRINEDFIPYLDYEGKKSFAAIVIVSVFYRTAFDDEWQRTNRAFTLGQKGEKMIEDWITQDDLDLDAARLIARPYSMTLATQEKAEDRA
jgi:hypothetical protein